MTISADLQLSLHPDDRALFSRYLDILAEPGQQQQHIDELTSALREANQRAKQGIDKIQQAVIDNSNPNPNPTNE